MPTTPDPILDAINAEIERLETAIAKLQSGIQEYEIGDRRVRYVDLPVLIGELKRVQRKLAQHLSGDSGRNRRIVFR